MLPAGLGVRLACLVGLALFALVPTSAAAAGADDGAAALCVLALIPGGTAGIPDTARPGSAVSLPSSWPQARRGFRPVHLRSDRRTFNRLYEFALGGGHLYARRRHASEPWRKVPVPSCLGGRLAAISADDDEMIALDRGRRVYTMDNALKAPTRWNWTSRWGPPVWTGPGFVLPPTDAWTWTVISPAEDKTWTDPAGNHTAIGAGKVSHIWGLRNGGRNLTSWDPWLPRDNSYEVCAPHRSRFRPVNVSASGSRLFVIGSRGDMFTRLYDFDISGHDPLFFRYSYADQRGKGDGAPIQLPAEPWTRQPKIPGRITSAISVSKRGTGAVHAILRVAGRKNGRAGFWQRDVAAPRRAGWRFRATGGPLEGKPLPNPQRNTSKRGLERGENARYEMRSGAARGVIENFNPYCSPARLRLREGSGPPKRLTLHTVDGLRQIPRARGLDGNSREQYGAIEYPSGRFEPVKVLATRGTIEIREKGWTFRRTGS